MTAFELTLCISATLSSSISQLCIKGASISTSRISALGLIGIGSTLMCCSVLMAVVVLRSLPLSQLVPFAAGAYVMVPLGGRLIFAEELKPRFWVGAAFIALGVTWIHS